MREGLLQPGQKTLPCAYFYDALGSALFDAICLLPEYGLWRADCRLLAQHASEIVSRIPDLGGVVELGSGSGTKTRQLLEELPKNLRRPYYPIDLSAAALERCYRELRDLTHIRVVPLQRPYLAGLAEAVSLRSRRSLLVLFLGSTIGNFTRRESEEFLTRLRQRLRAGDALLLSTDLEKPADQLRAAYDDPLGVTAAFNLNLLARINRELGADFPLHRFRHRVHYDAEQRRIEMHLEALEDCTVHIPGADLEVRFVRGETIWTESCYKYSPEEAVRLGEAAGFVAVAQWIDAEWPFAQTLFTVPGSTER